MADTAITFTVAQEDSRAIEEAMRQDESRPGIFAAIANLFKPKPRLLGIGKGKMKLEFVGDWDVTPEELFDDDEEAYFLPAEGRW